MNFSRISLWLWLWVGLVPLSNLINFLDHVGVIKFNIYILDDMMVFLESLFSQNVFFLSGIFLIFTLSWALFGFFTFYRTSKKLGLYTLVVCLLAIFLFQVKVLTFSSNLKYNLYILAFNVVTFTSLTTVYKTYPYIFFNKVGESGTDIQRAGFEEIKSRMGFIRDVSMGYTKAIDDSKGMDLPEALDHLRAKLDLAAIVLSTGDGLVIGASGGDQEEAAKTADFIKHLRSSEKDFKRVEISNGGYEYFFVAAAPREVMTYIRSSSRLEEIALDGINDSLVGIIKTYTGGD
jgi:hypothetical protein